MLAGAPILTVRPLLAAVSADLSLSLTCTCYMASVPRRPCPSVCFSGHPQGPILVGLGSCLQRLRAMWTVSGHGPEESRVGQEAGSSLQPVGAGSGSVGPCLAARLALVSCLGLFEAVLERDSWHSRQGWGVGSQLRPLTGMCPSPHSARGCMHSH